MRNRTIKPDFWSDPVLAKLPNGVRLAALGILSMSDDEGYFCADPAIIRSALWPFENDSSFVIGFLEQLEEAGYLEVRKTGKGDIGFIPSFAAQRVDKPRASALKHYFSIPGVVVEPSEKPPVVVVEESPNPAPADPPDPVAVVADVAASRPRKKRARKVKEPDPVTPELIQEPPAATDVAAPVVPKTAATWASYAEAFEQRYGVPPVRNATVNAQVSMFLSRIGAEEAPKVAEFYVWTNNQFYVSKGHPVALLLKDAESLRTQWVTGRVATQTQARQTDQTAARGAVFRKLLEEGENGVPEIG
jgi:hypothetical protein